LLSEEHLFDPTHRIEIAEAQREVSDTGGRPATEERFKTSLPLICVVCGPDDALKLMLHVLDFLNDRFVFEIECDDDDDVAFDILQSGVRPDVLLRRLPDATRTEFCVFGGVYAITAAGCVVPLFFGVVTQTLTFPVHSSTLVLSVYALGAPRLLVGVRCSRALESTTLGAPWERIRDESNRLRP
jgi:cytochrome c biogenesis protein CcdA